MSLIPKSAIYLACLIRRSEIKGVKIPGKNESLVISLFADDTTIYLTSKDSLEELWEILDSLPVCNQLAENVASTSVVTDWYISGNRIGLCAEFEFLARALFCAAVWI
jgi:hypothetical protein